jgi:hypothetical protein
MTHSPPPLRSCDRRQFLKLGAAGATAALAGCSELGSREHPDYTDWIPPSDDPTVAAYIDLRVSRESPEAERLLPLVLPSKEAAEAEEFVPEISGLDGIDDPLLRFPLAVGSQFLAAASLGISAGGFPRTVNPEYPDRLADEVVLADGIAIATTEIDTDEADQRLRSGTPAIPGRVEFERVGENEAFTLYSPTSSELDGFTAVSEDAVVTANTREKIRAALDAWRGDGARAVAESSTFGSLVETAGDGDFAVGWDGPIQLRDYYIGDQVDRPADGLVSRRRAAVASVSFSPDDGDVTAELAVRDDELDDSLRDRLESTLGGSSEDVSVTAEADRLSMTGTYADDALDIEFADPERTPEDERTPSGDPPPEIREAVPEDAVSFSYDGEQQVRVSFEREFPADEVTIRAIESGWETATTTPDAITYIDAYIDPDGDEVQVIVTIDGTSGIVARREFPE